MSILEEKKLLHNKKNYLNDIYVDKLSIYIEKYILLINQYLLHFTEDVFIQDTTYYLYILTKGIECISNIFNFLFLYTKNFDLLYYHCQKSIFYYIEFINQLENNDYINLKLTIKDAILFVYRKTIFQINEKKNEVKDNESKFLNDLCNICKEINKMYEFQLNQINYKINKKEIMNNLTINITKIYKTNANRNNILNIFIFYNNIITKISKFYDIDYVINVINYVSNKINKYSDNELENIIYKNSNFNCLEKYKNYTPLKLSNLFL
jgi:hypothetical protein